MGLLASRTGICLYSLLPNRWVWRLLLPAERAQIERANRVHNTERPDFANPSLYCQGRSFDVPVAPEWAARAAQLTEFLDRVRPASVLEVGPGSGHLTQIIVRHPAVRHYVAVDINGAFTAFLDERLQRLVKPGFSYRLITGTVADIPWSERFDAAILLSTVHHIPDRVALFHTLHDRVRPGGRVLAIDPTHYILRWWHVIRKFLQRGHMQNAWQSAREGRLSTHAMCQWSEYRAVTATCGWRVARVRFDHRPRRIERLRRLGVPLGPFTRWFAQEIAIECVRDRPHRSLVAAGWSCAVALFSMLFGIFRPEFQKTVSGFAPKLPKAVEFTQKS